MYSGKDFLLMLIAGATNGFMLAMMWEGNVPPIGIILGGIVAYAITKTVVGILGSLGSADSYQFVPGNFSWVHLILAGTLNGIVFAVLRPLFPPGMLLGVLAGIISFYSGDVVIGGLKAM